jgi:hypothetical protein
MTIAGVLSGLLGIGSGSLKVLAMDSTMKIPFKVSTTTSNFMIGVTAAASAVVYLNVDIWIGDCFSGCFRCIGRSFDRSEDIAENKSENTKDYFCCSHNSSCYRDDYKRYKP